jgi:deoxyribodipyrimidine photo-lyase
VNSALVWFRRDVRYYDNAALSGAHRVADADHCVFLFDTEILDPLQACAARATWLTGFSPGQAGYAR